MLITKEKDEEILFVLVNDSKNNKAEPRDINSKSPLSIFIKSIINFYKLAASQSSANDQ